MRNRFTWTVCVMVCTIFLLGLSSQGFAAAPKGPLDFVNAAKAQIVEVSAAQAKADLDGCRQEIYPA